MVPSLNTNSMLATLELQVIPEQKSGSEKYRAKYKNENQKSGFATFLVLISHLSFLRFPKNSKVKTHSKKTSFAVFLVRKQKNNARARRYSACKSIYILQKVFCSITFLFAQDPARIFLPKLISELRYFPSVGFPACHCLLLIPRSRFSDPVVAHRRAASSPARDFARYFPVFAWCLFGVYYNLEILSAVLTYPPKMA